MKNFRHMPETRRSSPAGQPAGRPLCAVGPPPSQQPLQPCPLPPDFKQRLTSQFDARAERYDVNNTYHPPLAERLVRMAALQPGQRVLDIGCGTGFVALLAAAAVGPGGKVTGVDLSEPMIRQARLRLSLSVPVASWRKNTASEGLPQTPVSRAACARFAFWKHHSPRVLAPRQPSSNLSTNLVAACCTRPRQAEEKAQAASLASFTSFLAADADACDFPPASFDAVLCSSALPFLPDIPAALARWRRWLRPGGRVGFNVPKVVCVCVWCVCGVCVCGEGGHCWLGREPRRLCVGLNNTQREREDLPEGWEAASSAPRPAPFPAPTLNPAATKTAPAHLQGVGSRAFTVYQRLAAAEGLALQDPCAAFADEAAVRRLLAAAGFSSAQLAVSTEVNMRMGQTPEEWAAAGWAMCAGMPFADLPALLGEGRMERMRRAYLVEAAEVAARFAGPEGVAEPYEMLWVLAAA